MISRVLLISAVVILVSSGCHKPVDSQSQPVERVVTRGAERSAPISRPSLLWISIDTWRWDYIGISGQGRVRTPTLDQLAREGVYEAEMVTPCPLTTPAHASMFTGQLLMNHGIFDCVNYTLDRNKTTVARIFQGNGYKTAAFVSAETLMKRFGLDNGFDAFDDSGIAKFGSNEWLSANKDGRLTTEAALKFLRQEQSGTPVFLFVHYFDLHLPYRPRPDYDRLYPTNPYAAQAAFVDDQVKQLLEFIRSDADHDWRLVIVGDHGEGHGDHGEIGHGYGLYRSTRHVPLIIYPKPERELIMPKPWGLIDLAPTLLEWFSLPALTAVDGLNLFESGPSDRSLPCMSLLSALMYSVNPNFGIRQGKFMYMKHGLEEFYDLEQDPDEQRNLVDQGSYEDIIARLRLECQRNFPMDQIMQLVSPTLDSSTDELQRLQSLGYMTGALPKQEDLQQADIRQLILDYNELTRTQTDYSHNKNLDGLVRGFRLFLGKYPRAVTVYRNFSKILLREGKLDDARPILEKVIALDDQDAISMCNLGTLMLRQGEIARARELLEKAISLDDSYPIAHKNLAILYTDFQKDAGKAVYHYKRYLELVPHSPEAPSIKAFIERQELGRD